jgi:diguanylate cyclase (GGDEF)-like protein/PAS domain S-box-containing protein
MLILDRKGYLEYINNFAAREFGVKPEKLTGRHIEDIFPPEAYRHLRAMIEKTIQSGEPVYIEGKVKFPKRELWLGTWFTPLKNDRGEVESILEVSRDITSRKVMEETLQEKERFLTSVFNSIQDGISVLDKDMRILRVNPTMERWYAYAMPLTGKKCYEAYHSRTSPCSICPTQRTFKTGEAAYEVVPKRGPKGTIIGWLDLYSFPLIDVKTGKLEGVIEYVRDITERKQAEDELWKMNKRLKELTVIDPHTGLYNHRYLEHIIDLEFHRCRRYNYPIAMTMVDIDYFQSINDVYGHKFGDLVLKQFAAILRRNTRRYDTIVRYGGEEFVIISPGTAKYKISILGERLLNNITLHEFGNKKRKVKLKVSIAVCSYPEDQVSCGMGMVEFVGRILNKVKEEGGNRVYSSADIKRKRSVPARSKDNQEIKVLKNRIGKLTRRGNQSIAEAIYAFAKTMEVKDHYTGEHAEKTVHYATEVARALKFPKKEVEAIEQAAILHDLGKIGVSEKILRKRGKLTRKEFDEIKRHPQIGADILRPIHFMHDIIPYILYHHERWDGKGYPTGLKGLEIPIGARIIAISDVYEALTSNRSYRKAYSEEKAIKIIKEASGTQFDPTIVDIFLKILARTK